MGKHIPSPEIRKLCAVCGTEFITKNANYKYCCAECREAYFKGKQAEYSARYRERNPEAARASAQAYRQRNLEMAQERSRQSMRQWREVNGEESRAQAKAYYQRNAEDRRAYQKQYREANRERVAAQWAVTTAIRRGDLLPAKTQVCVRCGDSATEYHHWSYERDCWLQVEAMCPTCHARADRERMEAESHDA